MRRLLAALAIAALGFLGAQLGAPAAPPGGPALAQSSAAFVD